MLVVFLPDVENFKGPRIRFEGTGSRGGIKEERCSVSSTVVIVKVRLHLYVLVRD